MRLRTTVVFAILLATAPVSALEPTPDAAPPARAGTADLTALAPFFESLGAIESGSRSDVLRVSWWGDSAIVSDGYTGELRRLMQERFGDGGPGFMLAAPAFDGYLRKGVRMKRHKWETASVLRGGRDDGRYGLGGVIATSFGGGGSTWTAQDDKPYDRVLVFYRSTPKAGGLQIYLDGGATAQTLAAAGEPSADRVWDVPVPAPAREVRLRAAGGGWSGVYGVALERRGPGVTLDALGVIGLRARRWSKANAEHLRHQIALRSPDLLVVNFGGNERVDPGLSAARHAGEITDLVARLRAGAPSAACLIVGPIAHGKGGTRVDPALSKIYDGQLTAARAAGCAFMDTLALMGGAQSVKSFRDRKLMGRDLAHLNGKGHREVGRLMNDWLVGAYDVWRAGP